MPSATREFLQRAFIVFLFVATALFLWRVSYIVLLVLAAGIFAVFVRVLARKLTAVVQLPVSWTVGFVVLALLSLLVLTFWLFGPRIIGDLAQLRQSLPGALEQLRGWLQQYSWGQFLLGQVPPVESLLPGVRRLLSGVTSVFTVVSNFLFALLFVFIAGVFFAADPELYRNGLLTLLPANRRPRACEVIDTTIYALWRWVLGQLIAMAVVGLTTAIGLWLLGVPLAFVLGLITALLNLVPFVGPIIAAVPAVLLAFTQSPLDALYVMLLVVIIQQVEGYILIPVLFEHAAALPPVLTLAAVVAMGLIFGILGALVAAPLLLILLLLVKMLYIQDMLGEPANLPKPGG